MTTKPKSFSYSWGGGYVAEEARVAVREVPGDSGLEASSNHWNPAGRIIFAFLRRLAIGDWV